MELNSEVIKRELNWSGSGVAVEWRRVSEETINKIYDIEIHGYGLD